MRLANKFGFLAFSLGLALNGACSDDGDGNGGDDVDASPAPVNCFDESEYFRGEATNTFDTDPVLGDPTNLTAPDFAPAVAITGGTPAAPFDTAANYIGAIGANDWTAGWTAYPDGDTPADQGTVTNVPGGDIDADTTWLAGNTYILEGPVFVTNGATLTVEADVLVRGQSGSALVVTNNGSIDVQGTSAEPVVFTSYKDDGTALAGDWGGLVLLGMAPINVAGGVDNVEGFAGQDDKTQFGGEDAAHNCGSIRYARIEYAGFELGLDNELNGLTVAGCGSDTTLDYIQVHLGEDDGIEFFGGTADLWHAVITQADDDSLDWDFGWSGNAQWLIAQQASTRGDNGFESDNNVNDNDATPRSSPTLWNVTLIGGGSPDQGGMTLRRGTAASINNAIIMNFGTFAVDVADHATVQQADGGDLTIQNSYFYDNAGGEEWPADFDGVGNSQNDCEG